MRVKICGITSIEDALLASKYGADAVGILVGLTHRSEDEVTLEEAKKIINALPPFITPVMVTHLLDHKEILEYIKHLQIATVQLHDEISIDEIINLREKAPYLKIIKTVHVTGSEAIEKAKMYEKVANGIELDSINPKEDRIGGTGITHDWNISKKIVASIKVPVILAGGLTPENVEIAIRTVSPYGVDVNSGVKVSKTSRKKDPEKLKKFIHNAKRAFLELSR